MIGLIYAGMECGAVVVTDQNDVWSSMAGGLGTGAVCQVARGITSMAVVGAIGGLTGGAAVAAKQAMKRYVPI